ncbi:MAG TPA: putative toxin-antitoxin system toxin component, PIN family [Anaerolineales bacterium]|nr:putative toxin-antitoxin system toxin component, PIN family [Anaerolineales bacterium]
MRVVIDTNVIVSAYLGGALEGIIVAWKSGKFTLVVSKEIAEEYLEVLRRPKFKIEQAEVDDFAALLLDRAEFVIPLETFTVIENDPTDNKFLEAAVAGKANLIVSGDGHLLELKSFRKISITTARKFVAKLLGEE